MKKIDIAFDLDSVLVDPMPVFKDVIYRRYGAKVVSLDHWHIKMEPDISFDQFIDSFQETYELYNLMPIMKGARRMLNRLHKLAPDDPIKIVTARRYNTAVVSLKLIKDRIFDGPFDLSFAPGEDKSKYLCHHHYFVEDRRKNALSLAENGIIVYMPDCPWNQDRPGYKIDHPKIKRIKGVYQLLPDVKKFIKEV